MLVLNCTLTLMSLSLQELWQLICWKPPKPQPPVRPPKPKPLVRRVLVFIGALTLMSHPRHELWQLTCRKASCGASQTTRVAQSLMNICLQPDHSPVGSGEPQRSMFQESPLSAIQHSIGKCSMAACLASMWFYNMCLKSHDLL